ncbi:MAG TPA: LytTR family DNA-binding domain-containing protein [Pseudolabrys sp.]|nr:LytTR family DNA-binding domain-containing protein [Pseudolabrys sp.]
MKRSSDSISVLVVDDETPARKRVMDLLARDPDVGRLLEAKNGIVAVKLIQGERPDIVFLDVQMPGVDGFGVIDALGPENMPVTVFVTAYDRFAVQAFETDAVDYLLKPFGDMRFEKTLGRAKARLREIRTGGSADMGVVGPELLKLAAKRAQPGEIWEWVVIRTRTATRLVMARDIDWIEAAGVYVTLHAGGQEFLYRASLSIVANRLDPFQFVRVHRSSIVNLRSIASLERRSHGEFEIQLNDGTRLMLSRSYRAHVETMLGQAL